MSLNRKFILAMAGYAVIAAFAGVTLSGAWFQVGHTLVDLRDMVWILLGAFALKTLIAYGRMRAEANEEAERHSRDSDD